MIEVLTPQEMNQADSLTIEGGIPGPVLMDTAGLAVANEVCEVVPQGSKVLCLAGPGNNGGDGYVALRYLAERGYEVRCVAILPEKGLRGDAKWALETSGLTPEPLDEDADLDGDIIIDALFGAGLDRDLTGPVSKVISQVNEKDCPVIAVDLPSGIDGATGLPLGVAIQATRTVTFFRLKPGHLLFPGRQHCGAVHVRQIGIMEQVLDGIAPATFHNGPELWCSVFSSLQPSAHKYDHGHALVVSGPMARTGAARLAAEAALRGGAGLVTVASPPDAMMVNATHLTSIMLRSMANASELAEILSDPRFSAVVIGPGCGVGEGTIDLVRTILTSEAALVLDADGLTSFSDAPEALWSAISGRAAPAVLTPHEGEFARLFPDLAAKKIGENGRTLDKLTRTRKAAARSGATIILKGADSVVAAPDGRASICSHAPPWLATAGSGDVLAGLVGAAVAQGFPAFQAASMAVWLHGEAGHIAGPGLIAEDLPKAAGRARGSLLSKAYRRYV